MAGQNTCEKQRAKLNSRNLWKRKKEKKRETKKKEESIFAKRGLKKNWKLKRETGEFGKKRNYYVLADGKTSQQNGTVNLWNSEKKKGKA